MEQHFQIFCDIAPEILKNGEQPDIKNYFPHNNWTLQLPIFSHNTGTETGHGRKVRLRSRYQFAYKRISTQTYALDVLNIQKEIFEAMAS